MRRVLQRAYTAASHLGSADLGSYVQDTDHSFQLLHIVFVLQNLALDSVDLLLFGQIDLSD